MIDSKILLSFIVLFSAFALNTILASNQDSIHLHRDSLLSLAEQTTDNKRKTDIYNQITLLYSKIDNAQTKKYADLAYDLAVSNKYQLGKAESLYNQAHLALRKNDNDQSSRLADRALFIIKEIPADTATLWLKAKTLEIKAWVMANNDEYYEAINCYGQAAKVYEELNDNDAAQQLLLNMGYTHQKVGDYDLASEYFNKAKIIYQRLNKYRNLVLCYNNTGYNLTKKEAYRQALDEYRKGLELADRHNITYSYSEQLYGMGLCLMKLGELDEALKKFEEAGKMYQEAKNENYEAYCNLFIAKIRFLQAQNPSLLAEMKKAYRIGEKYKNIELMQYGAEALAEAQASLGRFEEAYVQTNLANRLQDSIKNDELLLKLRATDSKNRFERAQRKMENEKKEELFQAKLGYQTKVSYLLFGFVSVLLLAGFLLYRAYKTTFKIKEQLVVNNNALRKTEERLSESNKEMQKYIDLNVELEQFAYIASHDIKAPLRTIQGFASVLKRKFYDRAEENEKTFFDFIEKGVKSLNLLVNDLLEYSKSNTKTLNIERLEFKDILEDVILNLDFSITQVNGTIDIINCDFSVNADQIKIKQIVQNILSNALKFKAENRDPIIHISARETSDFFIVSVKDNGIGIAEEHFDEVFEKFARLNAQSKYEGTGLGLSICAKYIKEHKGEISIHRNDDFGVTFTFSISKHLQLTEKENVLVDAH